MSNAEKALGVFSRLIGKEEGVSDWFELDQERVNAFADATLDRQFIHVDPEMAKNTPFGGTVAHGFLTLSMIPYLSAGITPADPAAYEGMVMAINYGLDKVRFPNPVRTGKRVRMRRELVSADLKPPSQIQLKQKCTIEIEGEDKPGCVAETLSRIVYG